MVDNGLTPSKKLNVFNDIIGTIGNTPLVRLNKVTNNLQCNMYAKVEFFNPGGSVKDRIGITIIEEAEQSGRLIPGGTIVESTSGNTGVGLAIMCAIKGYKAVFVMPDKMSNEKIQLLRAFGAKVVITPTSVAPEDPRSYYSVANKIVEDTPNAILANQYHNPENPRAHYLTTGPEIWEQTGGRVTDVIIGMGTGGTISGIGKYLKEKNPAINIIGVDATGSILKEIWENGGVIPAGAEAKTYKVEGIGEDFLPTATDMSVVDNIIRVTDKESFIMTRRLVKEEGIFIGGSCGSAVSAAIRYAKDLPNDRLVVVLLPDSGSRYLSKIFDDKWMKENGYLDTEWKEVTLRDILQTNGATDLIMAHKDDKISVVTSLLKANDISQVLVEDDSKKVIGIVREVDLLQQMLASKNENSDEETIAGIIHATPPSFVPNTLLENALGAVVENHIILVQDGENTLGILSKIDVLDFIYH
jgi:cystathionine beta-synthase